MSFGIVPMFFLGGFLAFVRQFYLFRTALKFRELVPGVKSRKIYK